MIFFLKKKIFLEIINFIYDLKFFPKIILFLNKTHNLNIFLKKKYFNLKIYNSYKKKINQYNLIIINIKKYNFFIRKKYIFFFNKIKKNNYIIFTILDLFYLIKKNKIFKKINFFIKYNLNDLYKKININKILKIYNINIINNYLLNIIYKKSEKFLYDIKKIFEYLLNNKNIFYLSKIIFFKYIKLINLFKKKKKYYIFKINIIIIFIKNIL